MPTERRFEVFRGQRRFVAGARVTLTDRGTFVFNRAALELFGSPEAVVYLYDSEASVVGFAPSTRAIPHAYPIHLNRAVGTGNCSALAFCRHYGINFEGGRKFKAEADEGRLIIELAKGEPVARRRPSRPSGGVAAPPAGEGV